MRLFATSDLHTDYVENFRWLKELSDTAYRDDALIKFIRLTEWTGPAFEGTRHGAAPLSSALR